MGLSVLDGVVSSVLSSSVVSCGLHVASYSLIRRVSCLLDQLVRSSSECHQHIPKQSRRGWLVSVCSCTEMSVSTLFGWTLCLLWYQSPFGADREGGADCRCKLWPAFNVSFACVSKWVRGKRKNRGTGPSVAQYPNHHHRLEWVFMDVVLECEDEE